MPAAEFQNFTAFLKFYQSALHSDLTYVRAPLYDLCFGNLPKGTFDNLSNTVGLAHVTDSQRLYTSSEVSIGFRNHTQGIAHKERVVY